MCIYSNRRLYIFYYILKEHKKIYVYILMGDYIFYCMLKACKKTNNYIFVCKIPFLKLKSS